MEQNQAASGQLYGNASVAVSTNGHTSAEASKGLPVDDRPKRCDCLVLGPGY